MSKRGNDKIKEYGKKTQFPKGIKPPNSGRKKSLLQGFLKENKTSKKDVILIAQNFLFTYTIDELKTLVRTKEKRNSIPAFVYNLITAYIKDCEVGRTNVTTWLAEYVYGKADQNINLGKKEDPISSMTQEEKLAKIAELEKSMQEMNKKALKKRKEIEENIGKEVIEKVVKEKAAGDAASKGKKGK